MQSQSETYKCKFKSKISTNNNSRSQQQLQRLEQQRQEQQHIEATTTNTTVVCGKTFNSQQQQQLRRATVKVIKCKNPLCHFKFYLDICDHQLAKRIEEQIRRLGGALEFFLTASVTHFITDKVIVGGNNNSNNNNNSNSNNSSLNSRPSTPVRTPQSPGTPKTPQTPCAYDTITTPATTAQDGKTNTVGVGIGIDGNISGSIRKVVNTRANAILNRVRRESTTTTQTTTTTPTHPSSLNVSAINSLEAPNSPTRPISSKESASKQPGPSRPSTIVVSTQSPYIVWQTEYALHFFKKVQHELKDYLKLGGETTTCSARQDHASHKLVSIQKIGRSIGDPIDLKGGGFLKIESIKRNYRPYYQLFRKSSGTEWPKIDLTREDGAFRLSPKKKLQINLVEAITVVAPSAEAQKRERDKLKEEAGEEYQKMTRKSRSRSSQQHSHHNPPMHAAVQTLKKGAGAARDSAATIRSSRGNSLAGGCKQMKESSDKQCGVCEICKIEYDTLTIHLKTKDHEYFAKNSQNFIALDSLIQTSANVNKFLGDDKKVDLEEMEVENIEVMADANAPDPLEGSEPVMGGGVSFGVQPGRVDKGRKAGGSTSGGGEATDHTPSPTLREKSKRSTKGKHSSEKFQNLRLIKPPIKLPDTSAATTNKSQTSKSKQLHVGPSKTSSILEVQRIESSAGTNTITAPADGSTAFSVRRKATAAGSVSPPIRAMFPPSSLYKVVGTLEHTTASTPPRKTRGGEAQVGGGKHATASPSLIVKFKKVRAAELNRLNGEAESFMFPKQRTSSELPTDIDRHTTSENARGRSASTSLDSISSEDDMDIDVDDVDTESRKKQQFGSYKKMGKRAIASGKRRIGISDVQAKAATTKQRFPNAPIQPELKLKDRKKGRGATCKSAIAYAAKQKNTTTLPTISVLGTERRPISAAAAKANAAAAVLAAITLPEATRKSSRTATAIVTAATTSSRLLRAAVEAAKYNCRNIGVANETLANGSKKSSTNEDVSPVRIAVRTPTRGTTSKATEIAACTTTTTKSSHNRISVVKMEDRVGDIKNNQRKGKSLKRKFRYSGDEVVDEEEKAIHTAKKCIKMEKKSANSLDDVVRKYRRGVNDTKSDAVDDDDIIVNEDDDDDDDLDYEDEEVDNDDEKDEDYIHCIRNRRKSFAYDHISAMWQSTSSSASRKQRALQREEQKDKLEMLISTAEQNTVMSGRTIRASRGRKKEYFNNTKSTKIVKVKTNAPVNSSAVNDEPTAMAHSQNSKSIQKGFDISKSTRLNQMRYSFERVPDTDLWYRVFTRQDNCTERYFEYYGSTNYRKLPYELGPTPFGHTITNDLCCRLCEKQKTSEYLTIKDDGSREVLAAPIPKSKNVCNVRDESMEYGVELSEAEVRRSRDSVGGKCNETTGNVNDSGAMSDNLNNDDKVRVSFSANTVPDTTGSPQMTTTTMTTSTNSTAQYKHKKLAFLQRYRQEQQELLQKQKSEQDSTQQGDDNSTHMLQPCGDSKDSMQSIQDQHIRERKRAGSTHSTTSSTSCGSSTATMKTKKNQYLNKHLNKAAAAFLNLELPPRKSPREHASTLALVSCIIKQRQDSQSKPNSETDEPFVIARSVLQTAEETPKTSASPKSDKIAESTTSSTKMIMGSSATYSSTTGASNMNVPMFNNSELSSSALRSPRHTRSAAATPVEEMRFTTEISENVKRMRRGQNKYDHSPAIALTKSNTSSRHRGGSSTNGGRGSTNRQAIGRPPRAYYGLKNFLCPTMVRNTGSRCNQAPTAQVSSIKRATTSIPVSVVAKRRRVKCGVGWITTGGVTTGLRHHSYTGLQAQGTSLPSIRKTGSKKGVLEFEVDVTALKALDAATQYTNVHQLEWQIDSYLQLFGSEYDLAMEDHDIGKKDSAKRETPPSATMSTAKSMKKSNLSALSIESTTAKPSNSTKGLQRLTLVSHADVKSNAILQAPVDMNTPPPTDYFSSDFDLYDLFTNAVGGSASSEDEQTADVTSKRKRPGFSLYSSMAMQNYFRKRKSLKSNRTGWPKAQRKKTSVRQQHLLAQKIRFLQEIGELASNDGIKQEKNCESSRGEGDDDEREEGNGVEEEGGGTEEHAEAADQRYRELQRGNVITPPESEAEVIQNSVVNRNEKDAETAAEADDDGETELDVMESIPGDDNDDDHVEFENDGETMIDSIEDVEEEATRTERDADTDVEGEADEEEDEEDDADFDTVDATNVEANTVEENVTNEDDGDTRMNEESNFAPVARNRNRQRRLRRTIASPISNEHLTLANSLVTSVYANSVVSAATSNNGDPLTPTTQALRASSLRRTPQLFNGSLLGSCISPVEKTGDNSDIFTVSSDGLDTDLDLSNSQHEHLHHHHHLQHQDQCVAHQTPKRKFDLSKYAPPNNAASSSCAAEAATAAVKSLAISQFLKKEVRVTCRRLRAPFRRYRYRR